jgi:hypothetical protein
MIDSDTLFHLKEKYGNIYSVDIKGSTLVFRELTFQEYSKIMYLRGIEDYSSADVEDYILSYSVVYPEDFDLNKIPPGNVSALAENVLDISGITSVKLAIRIMNEKRAEINEVKNLMKAFVLATITSYTPEQLEAMTFSELAEKVALSEKIIEIQQAIHNIPSNNISLQLIDPEEEEEKEKQKAAKHNLAKMPGAATYGDPIAQKLWGSG